MQRFQLTTSTDEDGVLNIRIPMETPRQQLEVLVVLQPLSAHTAERPELEEWPKGYFKTTAGAFQADPISRANQGEYEIREKIE